jgi:cell division protein FtsB
MNYTSRHLQRLSQKAIGPFFVLSIMGYFIYHSIQGERGILAWIQLKDHLLKTESELKDVMTERLHLEEKVQDLRPESLNRDLLDQQVRLQLGYTRPDEIIILREESENLEDLIMKSLSEQ